MDEKELNILSKHQRKKDRLIQTKRTEKSDLKEKEWALKHTHTHAHKYTYTRHNTTTYERKYASISLFVFLPKICYSHFHWTVQMVYKSMRWEFEHLYRKCEMSEWKTSRTNAWQRTKRTFTCSHGLRWCCWGVRSVCTVCKTENTFNFVRQFFLFYFISFSLIFSCALWKFPRMSISRVVNVAFICQLSLSIFTNPVNSFHRFAIFVSLFRLFLFFFSLFLCRSQNTYTQTKRARPIPFIIRFSVYTKHVRSHARLFFSLLNFVNHVAITLIPNFG